MKYVEPIKSFVLLFLVLLSLLFTFLIWNYRPNNLPTEEQPSKQAMMTEVKTSLGKVSRPYRMLSVTGEGLRGTTSTGEIDYIIQYLEKLKVTDFSPIPTPLTKAKVNEMVRTPDRMTMFFRTETPVQIFGEVASPDEEEYEGATFDRIIIDWGELSLAGQTRLLFINTASETGYRADIEVRDADSFMESFVEQPKSYMEYEEVERPENLSLYVVKEPVEATKHAYGIGEMPLKLLKDILFENPSIVQKSGEGSQEKYSDSMALLTLDTDTKVMNYVHPVAESSIPVSPYDLLKDTFDFLNEHGGFTADYRLTSMNVQTHVTEFQLYMKGYPVFSPTVLTRLVTTWGEEKIFRYRRPYYFLDTEFPSEKAVMKLPSGTQVVDYINSQEELGMDEIDDIIVGYYLLQNENSLLFTLEPSWFLITENGWSRLSSERLGGDEHGLE
ncbi:MAG: YycH family regulatory protein [Lysinibacillus sp.]